LRPLVEETVEFSRLPQAKARMEAGGHVGKSARRRLGGLKGLVPPA
jgi:hypothetical protein